MPDEFTREEKHDCARREVAMRRKVYARRVEDGRMQPEEAAREIAMMEEIARDYASQGRLDL